MQNNKIFIYFSFSHLPELVVAAVEVIRNDVDLKYDHDSSAEYARTSEDPYLSYFGAESKNKLIFDLKKNSGFERYRD